MFVISIVALQVAAVDEFEKTDVYVHMLPGTLVSASATV